MQGSSPTVQASCPGSRTKHPRLRWSPAPRHWYEWSSKNGDARLTTAYPDVSAPIGVIVTTAQRRRVNLGLDVSMPIICPNLTVVADVEIDRAWLRNGIRIRVCYCCWDIIP